VTGFRVRSEITDVEVIASGTGVRVRAKLKKAYGAGRWRKLKGTALVELPDGNVPGLSYTGTRPTVSGVGT